MDDIFREKLNLDELFTQDKEEIATKQRYTRKY